MRNASEVPDEVALRMKRLREAFAAAPVVELVGVVGASGAGGGQTPPETLWTLLFGFAVWRVAGQTVRDAPLTIRQEVPHEELQRLMGILRPYKVFRIRARLVERLESWKPQAYMESIVGEDDADREMNAFARQLQEPVTYHDAQFGTLTLDRRLDRYDGKANWDGQPVRLTLSIEEPGGLDGALATARALWQEQASWATRIREFAVAKLLPLKNDNWLDDDDAELTPAEFLGRMKLESISLSPDGSFDFWQNDGDLFWGHAIQISGNLSEGPKYADIPG